MTGGRSHAPIRAYMAVAAFLLLLDTVNVLNILHDTAARGQALLLWKPITWEATSGLAELLACIVIHAALRLAPPDRGPWTQTLLVHAVASVLFSATHIAGMLLLRMAAYALAGARYPVALADLPYEYRKDVLAYLVLAGIFWLFDRSAPSAATAEETPATALFDIVLGTRILRVPANDILLVRAAGNYVELRLADGRTPLMRTSLRRLQATLEGFGFVRTHRSWMVNGRRIRGLSPAGSGDFQVEMEGGVQAPLSRRFPDALARLRAPGGPSSA